ncbi:MAG: response regulator [Spirochaetia bacterium]
MDIMLVDDHRILVEGLKTLITTEGKHRIVATAENAEEAIQKVEGALPELVIMDIGLPGMDGIEASKLMLEKVPNLKIVILSSANTFLNVKIALQAGIKGYVHKSRNFNELLKAIELVKVGKRYVSQELSQQLYEFMAEDNPLNVLTDRELEIFKYLCRGKTADKIAKSIGVARNTVDVHKRNILKKLECKNIQQLIQFALKNNLISTDN